MGNNKTVWDTIFPKRSGSYLNFLARKWDKDHNKDEIRLTCPCWIDMILEEKFGIQIVFLDGMIDDCGMLGSMSPSGDFLFVDPILLKDPNEFRLTIAHEIAHFVFHRKIYHDIEDSSGQVKFDSVDSWIDIYYSRPVGLHDRLEMQAEVLSRLMLVPSWRLLKIFDYRIRKAELASNRWADLPSETVEVFTKKLSDYFEVSKDVIELRMLDESLDQF